MKKSLIAILALGLVTGLSSLAFSAEFNNPAGGNAATTTLGGSVFSPSTNVAIDMIASATQYSISGKHIAGGVTEYGTTETATNFTATTGRAADDTVTNQGTAGTLATP